MKSFKRTVPALFSLVLLATPVAWSFQGSETSKRFDEFEMRREGGVIAVAPVDLQRLVPVDPVRTGWEGFRRGKGGAWRVFLDERSGTPTLVTGTGSVWFTEDELKTLTLADLEERSRRFVDDHADLLGGDSSTVVLDPSASVELRSGYWQVVFRRSADGVRVENSRFDFHVDGGRLKMFGGAHWAKPQVSGVPEIDAGSAREILDAYLDESTDEFVSAGEPELALVAIDAAPQATGPRRWSGPRGEGLSHRLIWRLRFQVPGEPSLWTGEIDAHQGTVVAFYDDAHHATIRGGVFPISPDGECAEGGCEIEGLPMPFADYSEAGSEDAFTDAYGNLTCVDPAASIETNLSGPYVEVRDSCGPVVGAGTCSDGADLGLKAGENCDVQPGAAPGNTAAARTGYYHLNRVAEAARFYNPGNVWLQGRVILNTNRPGECDAVWNGQVNTYLAGGGCANTGEISAVLVHEWGHGYDHNDGGGQDNTSEAYADVVALLATRDSCIGRGFYTDGYTCHGWGDTCLTCTGVRDHDWTARVANTPATPQGFVQNRCPGGDGPCGFQGHCEAYPIVEAMYDLATRDLPATGMDIDTSWQLVEELWYGTRAGSGGDIYTCALPDSDSCGASSWYQRMRSMDDDDANLANGTPHAAALYAAFARHNIACGLAEDPENQSTGCQALETPDVEVGGDSGGVEVEWVSVPGAAEYVVYRGDLGCTRQLVPVATVPGSETTWVDPEGFADFPRHYRVQAVGLNPACRSAVSECLATPYGPRLQKMSHRILEQGANANHDGLIDPGETVRIPVTLFNSGTSDATGVTGNLRSLDPEAIRVLDPIASWNDIAEGAELESVDPHFELTVLDGVQCGDVAELELDIGTAGAATRTVRVPLAIGAVGSNDYPDDIPDGGVTIPQQTPSPMQFELEIADAGTISEVDVSIVIFHFDATELVVELTSPEGTTVRLHDRTDNTFPSGLVARFDAERDPDGPGTMDDFVGESTAGTWTLSVSDEEVGAVPAGDMLDWTLHVTHSDCAAFTCPEPTPTEAVTNLVVGRSDVGGDGSVDLSFGWDALSGAAGYHLLESTTAGFDGIVDLAGRTDGAPTLVVESNEGSAAGLTYYTVRAVNECNQEGP